MDQLHVKAERLRALLKDRPGPAAWSDVRDALDSKWEGIQSLALQVLGVWGGHDAVATIKTFLLATSARQNAWAIRVWRSRRYVRT